MNQLLPFKLGDEIYALEVTDIQEVIENQLIFPIPGSPGQISGAVSFHGRIVPVIDLPQLLGFPVGKRSERVIVLTDLHGPVGLRVEHLRRIITVDLVHGTLSQSDSGQNCISGVLNWQGEMLNLLDLQQLRQRIEVLCSRNGG